MKKVLLASAAVVVSALPMSVQAADLPKAAPVAATPQATGYVEVYTGWISTRESGTLFDEGGSFTQSFSDSFKGTVLGGAGRGNYWLTPSYSMQMDVQAEGTAPPR